MDDKNKDSDQDEVDGVSSTIPLRRISQTNEFIATKSFKYPKKKAHKEQQGDPLAESLGTTSVRGDSRFAKVSGDEVKNEPTIAPIRTRLDAQVDGPVSLYNMPQMALPSPYLLDDEGFWLSDPTTSEGETGISGLGDLAGEAGNHGLQSEEGNGAPPPLDEETPRAPSDILVATDSQSSCSHGDGEDGLSFTPPSVADKGTEFIPQRLGDQAGSSLESEVDVQEDGDINITANTRLTIEEVNSYREKVGGGLKKRLSRRLSAFGSSLASRNSLDVSFGKFAETLDCKTSVLPKRIFHVLSKNGMQITHESLVEAMVKSECGQIGDKLRFAFDIYDIDGSGDIGVEDLRMSLEACLEENNLKMDSETLGTVVATTLRVVANPETGTMSFKDFEACIMAKPQVARSFRASKPGMIPSRTVKREESRSCTNLFSFTDPSSTYLGRKAGKTYSYCVNNHQRIAVVGLTLAMCIACFYWRFDMWANTPKQRFMTWSLPVAKGCGQAMKVTFSVILFPVSRNAVTWARNTYLGNIIPFDDAISYHKMVGRLGFMFATVHTICHVVDIRYWGDKSRGDLYDLAFPEGPSQPSYWALVTSQIGITGMGIYVILIVAYSFALDYPRRSKWIVHTKLGQVLNNFNYFWYTHHLFAVFYILLLLHPSPGIPDEANEWGVSDFWVWGGVPILVYVVERFLRIYRQRTWQTKVLYTESLPGKVMAMYISKPKRFRYKSGMYVFLNCPQLSQFEWHPYTMTSAPRDEFIGVHVAALGDWSSAMNDMFSSLEVQQLDSRAIQQHMSERTGSRSTPTKALLKDSKVEMSDNSSRVDSTCSVGASSSTSFLTIVPDKMKVYVDGPYGAPAQDYEQYRVLLLVGAGIGITPFASMLRNMLNQFEDHRCMHCGKVTLNESFKIRKIYFYWVVRDPQSAMWFNKELQALKNDDHSGILDINIHVTGVQKAEDVRSKLLQVVQKVYHDETGVDIITGGPATALTKFGRPNWASVFKGIKSKHPRTLVGVFFCGQPLLGKELGKCCRTHTEKRGTKFEFLFERF